MPFMLKIQWDIKAGREADFRDNQAALCKVMLEHPGVICYHVDYPSQRVSQWTEIYATDEAFAAHLANDKARVRWQQSLTRAIRLPVNAGGTQTPAPKSSSPVLGRLITRRPQTLLS
jgi:quinol monooxygenase YgiN